MAEDVSEILQEALALPTEARSPRRGKIWSLIYGFSRYGSAINFVLANPTRSRAPSLFSRITARSRFPALPPL
jgi:hypothetical protein